MYLSKITRLYRVAGFMTREGNVVDSFDNPKCTLVIVSERTKVNGKGFWGPSYPVPKKEFRRHVSVDQKFEETIVRKIVNRKGT